MQFGAYMKWHRRVHSPRNIGEFTEKDAKAAQAFLVCAQEGDPSLGECIAFYWLVDPEDGVILDVKFRVFGSAELIGVGDIVCELLLRKSYRQALRIDSSLLESLCGMSINLILFAIEKGAAACMHISVSEIYSASPVAASYGEARKYPNWENLTSQEQIAIITSTIDQEIAPYIALDAGGVQVLDVVHSCEVKIAYQGSCTSCPSATGSTLDAIQQILRVKVCEDLIVVPDMSFLTSDKS